MMAPTTAPLGPDAASVRSPSRSAPSLTRRERDVLLLLTRLTQKEAAAWLGISRSTVRWYLASAYDKFDTSSLVQTYCALGWLVPRDSGALLAELRSAA